MNEESGEQYVPIPLPSPFAAAATRRDVNFSGGEIMSIQRKPAWEDKGRGKLLQRATSEGGGLGDYRGQLDMEGRLPRGW